jgi:phage-related protein
MGAMEIFRVVGRIAYEGGEAVEAGLQRLETQVQGVQSSFSRFGESAQAVGSKISGVGETLSARVTAPLAALGAGGVYVASQMDESQKRIQASLGLTEERAKELHEVARSVWKNGFGEDVIDAGKALATVDKNMKNLNDADLKTVTEAAYTFADLWEFDIAETTRSAGALMDNFGVSGTQAMDLIAVAAQRGGDYSQELLGTFYEYAPQFKRLGYDAEGFTATLIAGAESGAFSMDKLADATKEGILKMGEGSDEVRATLGSIGLDADQVVGGINAGGEKAQQSFMAVSAAIAGIEDPAKKNAAAIALFGTPLEDLGPEFATFFASVDQDLGKTEGAAKAAGDTLYDTFGGRLTVAFRTFQDALVPIGEILINILEPAIAALTDKITQLATWFQSLSPQMQNAIVFFGIIAAVIGPVLVVVGTLISSIGAIATAIAGVSLVVMGWVAVIALIVAAVVAAYFKFEEFRNGVNAVFTFIRDLIMLAVGAVVSFMQEKLAQIQAFWAQHGTMIMEAVSNAFNFIKGVIDFIMPTILFVIQAVWNSIKGVINGVLNFIMGLILVFSGLLTGNFGAMWEGVKQMFFGALEAIWNYMNLMMIGRLITIIKNFAVGGFNLVVGFGKNIVNAFKNMWNSASSAVSSGVQAVIRFFQKMFDDAARIFSILRQTGDNIFNAIRNTITSIAQNIASKVGSVFTGMKNTVVNVFNNVKSAAQTAFNAVKTAIQNPIQTAVNFVRNQVDKIKGFFSGMNIRFPKIKLPHFSLAGNFSLNPPSVPKLSVDWYKDGGVFDGASVIGVGEAGPEAVLPLLGERMAPFAKAVSDNLQGMGSGGNLTVILEMDSYQMGKVVTPNVSMNQGNEVRIKTFMKGGRIG